MRPLQAVLMRGGTSRGVIFKDEDLPPGEEQRLEIFREVLGSPDPTGRQVDGVGGGNATTSKAAVVRPSGHSDYDVDYTFYQVGVTEPEIGVRGNCGNLTSAVAAYAVNEGWVPTNSAEARVRIFNTNTRKHIVAWVPTEDGRARSHGRCELRGVPRPGAPIRLEFLEPGGAVTGRLLPTGRAVDILELPDGERVRGSIVDAANPVILLDAEDVRASATWLPAEVAANPELLRRLDAARAVAAVRLGLADSPAQARNQSATLPFVGFVGRMERHMLSDGSELGPSDADILVRFLSGGVPHAALPLTAALCTAVATGVERTLANEMVSDRGKREETVRLAHPSGVLEVGRRVVRQVGVWRAESASVTLTARTIMSGVVWASG